LSPEWHINHLKLQQVFAEIIDCALHGGLRDLFLLSKTLELLVLVADQRSATTPLQFVKTQQDRDKLVAAQAMLNQAIDSPPTIPELARQVGLNEYKLKRGFKELFGTTIFGFVHQKRMHIARQLLLDTDLSAKEISYRAGYSSPQHFSRAFKAEFGQSPDRMRKAPDRASS
ncbi:MAG: AraC family transcriptional regulator, partial [Bacteroidota bacterium]